MLEKKGTLTTVKKIDVSNVASPGKLTAIKVPPGRR